MNKSALKKFATEARRELLERVELQARKIGITKDLIQTANVESSDAVFIDGVHLSHIERKQRNKLIARIEEIGFERVMDETAYTWFNRFVALRFMEVNEYLPTKVRVLSSSNEESVEPDMMREALSLDLEVDKERIYALKMNNDTDGLFKYLIKVHCNDLNRYMPFMFESIEDYKEILFPEGLLGSDALISRLINVELIPEDDWTNIEIIGWLYQYYIAEEKDRVFKAKAKYKAEEIPYATQLFTPDWIVQYMVQNSLGRYWTEAHPEHEDLINDWNFFIHHEEDDFQEKIAPYINKELNIEDIKCFDPAMGSGHILVYMFDVLYEIYTKCGYMEREIPRLIIENNLYGLDIDDRAHQLASFSVVMKALQYNRRFLRSIEREGLVLNLASVQETNGWTDALCVYLSGEESGSTYNSVKLFVEQYKNGKTFGSLIRLSETDTSFVEQKLSELKGSPVTTLFEENQREQVLELLPLLIHQTKIMRQKYDVVVMNPPYMGYNNMNEDLSNFLVKYYPDSKADLFAAFMDIDHYLQKNSFYAAINQHSWMFLSSFEKLRSKIINGKFIDTMLHLGTRVFEEIGGEVVQSTTFIFRNKALNGAKGIYVRLVDEKTTQQKREQFTKSLQKPNSNCYFTFNQLHFKRIPRKPLVYWLSNPNIFNDKKMSELFISGGRNKTHNNEKYVRYFWEIVSEDEKWVSYSNGGDHKKYYGNTYFVLDWSREAREFYLSNGGLVNKKFWGKEGLTWNLINSFKSGFRIKEQDSIFSSGSPTIFNETYEVDYYILGYLNSKVAQYLLKMVNPTINLKVGDVLSLPIILSDYPEKVTQLVLDNIEIAKKDCNFEEISKGFTIHPILKHADSGNVENSIIKHLSLKKELIKSTKRNEEKINQIFIDLYSLQKEIDNEVSESNITIFVPQQEDILKSFLSYLIGNVFGRYSLNKKGIIFEGGEIDPLYYKTFPISEDNILPILPSDYLEADIVAQVIDFVRMTFGEEMLEENLNYISFALGRKANETSKETLRRYFLNDFYKDHVQTYKKRPIYWMFTSGKEKAFNCLIYMHRYDKTTLSRVRTDYLHEVQNRMDAEKKDLLAVIEGDSTTKEISNSKKILKSLDKKIDELKAYDELLHHMADQQIEIDLDDGVKVNYEKFKGLVAKIN